MKKIAMISVHNHNYGSILQAYALQQVLIRMEYDVKIILYKKTNIFKQALRLFYIPLLKANVKMKYKSFYCKLFNRKVYQDILVPREKAFIDFISNNMNFSKTYVGRKNLIAGCANYDAFVLGSDQVWNPMNLGADFFTMTFIPDGKLKVTYAPSFGVSEIPKYQRKKTSYYLKRISHISVREVSGEKIVKSLTGRDVPVVLDPTMLLPREIWDEAKGEPIVKEPYILCYFISAIPSHRKFAKELSHKTKCKIVTIPHVDEYVKADDGFGDIVPKEVGPLEFVNLISNAEYVCTDSFHGTVFSILYEKKFFTFNRFISNGKVSTNSRLYSILQLLKLEYRLRDSSKKIMENDLNPIDYCIPYKHLSDLRESSKDYLKMALRG